MKTLVCLWVLGVMMMGSAIERGYADVFEAAPAEIAFLPSEEGGMVSVALRFEFPVLRSGSNRRIEEALLDWTLSNRSYADAPEFFAYQVMEQWTKAGAEAGERIGVSEAPAADWLMTPLTTEESGPGLVRLDLRQLVEAWTNGSVTNYGIIVTTKECERDNLADALREAKLTVRYGFRDY